MKEPGVYFYVGLEVRSLHKPIQPIWLRLTIALDNSVLLRQRLGTLR
ncbi:MAG TPA: hypothetical protein VIQ31_02025 [Phormidium sp.]